MSGSMDPLPAGLPAPAHGLFTTRAGGVSRAPWDELNLANHVGDEPAAVEANRSELTAHLGDVPLAVATQVHGAAVAVVDGPLTDPPQADALVTADSGIALLVLVADCLPILLADPVNRVVAAVHAGRPGLAAGVLQQAIAGMQALGAAPADSVAVIGPGVCGSCYEVPREMRDAVAAVLPGSAASTRRGTPSLDLATGAERMLSGLGVGTVRRTGICTMADQRFYSHRRDGRTGRFAGVVMLTR